MSKQKCPKHDECGQCRERWGVSYAGIGAEEREICMAEVEANNKRIRGGTMKTLVLFGTMEFHGCGSAHGGDEKRCDVHAIDEAIVVEGLDDDEIEYSAEHIAGNRDYVIPALYDGRIEYV